MPLPVEPWAEEHCAARAARTGFTGDDRDNFEFLCTDLLSALPAQCASPLLRPTRSDFEAEL